MVQHDGYQQQTAVHYHGSKHQALSGRSSDKGLGMAHALGMVHVLGCAWRMYGLWHIYSNCNIATGSSFYAQQFYIVTSDRAHHELCYAWRVGCAVAHVYRERGQGTPLGAGLRLLAANCYAP